MERDFKNRAPVFLVAWGLVFRGRLELNLKASHENTTSHRG